MKNRPNYSGQMGDKFLEKIPVIVDTDIGGDIDDAWALAMLLKMPQFDIKLITTAVGDTLSRAKIVAKMLERADRTDIPIGIGLPFVNMDCYYKGWADDYVLDNYPGKIYQDGVEAIVDTVKSSSQEVVILAIAPLTNIAAALKRWPGITAHSRIVAMLGSVYKGYSGKSVISKECNVVNNIPAAKEVFASDWDMLVTPLDTCGMIRLTGAKYNRIVVSKDPLIESVIENYAFWICRPGFAPNPKFTFSDLHLHSSILYDTVAVYMATETDMLEIQTVGLKITDDGYTIPDPDGKQVRCALDWKKGTAFEDYIVNVLVGKSAPQFTRPIVAVGESSLNVGSLASGVK
ncbi:MAG: Pyrimidine-specific ribonucleoside hydrolase RihB [Planctomycetes bacterium ADurb.Bin401]|nr:MAG: Pyrimidine-specific ribonucleoside hydrolase RihB [Planctomycetes bacterium ADurb.Bin401]